MLILFVDDDVEEFEIFCEALKTFNTVCKCLHVYDGQEAFDLLNNKLTILPDYIFLDINMPVMNGMECLQKIKAEPKLRDIPVIVYSTTSNPFEMGIYRNLGAAEFIVKPSSFIKLVNILRQFVER